MDLRALRAAAKVAGLLSFGACAGRDELPAAEPDKAELATVDPVTAPAAAAEAPAAEAGEEELEPIKDEDPAAVCREEVKYAFDEKGQLMPGKNKEAVATCCQTIADAVDAQRSNQSRDQSLDMAWETRSQCCSMLEWRGSMACTPWGPPAPASFTDSDRTRQASAAWKIDWTREVARLAAQLGHAQDPELQEVARATWSARMVNETVSSRVFTSLAQQLEAAGFEAEEVERWSEFSQEELRHGQLCGAVVEALGGEARATSGELAVVPRHADVDARQAALRNVMSVSCLSETVAVALIGSEREEMPEGALRDLLTRIYSDEVGHARAGWRLLASALEEEPWRKADLLAYLPVALDEMVRFELEHIPGGRGLQEPSMRWPEQSRRWGLCAGERARSLLFACVDRVIAPRLAQVLA